MTLTQLRDLYRDAEARSETQLKLVRKARSKFEAALENLIQEERMHARLRANEDRLELRIQALTKKESR
jgi:hypothetical protein